MIIKDYVNLENFFKITNVLNVLKKKIQLKKNKIYQADTIKIIIALALLDINLKKAREMFTGNRYFLNSLKIPIYPSQDNIKKTNIYLKKKFNVKNDFFLKKKILKFLNKEIVNFNSSQIPNIFKKNKKIILSKKMKNYFSKNGYLIVKNAFSSKLANKVNKKLKNLAKKENKINKSFKYGSGKLQRIYHLINKGKIYQELILHPLVKEMCDYAFDRKTLHSKYYLSSWHCNILNPGAESQKIHHDAAVPEPLPPWIIRLNVNFITQDYYKDNGATTYIPGSHKFLRKPNLSKINKRKKKYLEAPKGSLIFWHGHLWHQSGPNNSNMDRVALLGCFSTSVFREMCMEENPYLSLNKNIRNNFGKNLKELIGWYHGVKT